MQVLSSAQAGVTPQDCSIDGRCTLLYLAHSRTESERHQTLPGPSAFYCREVPAPLGFELPAPTTMRAAEQA